MILKSMSRSNKSFASLYDYFCKDSQVNLRGFNIFSSADNKAEVIKEFLENAKYLKTARGKNYLYHEIISLRKNSLSYDKQKAILEDLAFKYLSLRAENHLALTALHFDKGHIHIHLMISSNRIMENKRTRLSKKKFHFIQQQIEKYTNKNHPELEATNHYLKAKDFNKEKLKRLLKEAFEQTNSFSDLKEYLNDLDIELYTRGKTIGVIFHSKRHRLKTLGLENLYFQTFEKDDKISKRQKEMEKIREQQNKDSEFER